MSIAFPNESQEYRAARAALAQREAELVRQMEAVAAQRQSLPPGGQIPEDYIFDRIGDDGTPTTVRISELFGGSDTLMLYNPMFPRLCGDDRPIPTSGIFAELPADQAPCPSCTALVDMWDGMFAQLDGLGGKPTRCTRCAPLASMSARTSSASSSKRSSTTIAGLLPSAQRSTKKLPAPAVDSCTTWAPI